jgi:hypothetical protein
MQQHLKNTQQQTRSFFIIELKRMSDATDHYLERAKQKTEAQFDSLMRPYLSFCLLPLLAYVLFWAGMWMLLQVLS